MKYRIDIFTDGNKNEYGEPKVILSFTVNRTAKEMEKTATEYNLKKINKNYVARIANNTDIQFIKI